MNFSDTFPIMKFFNSFTYAPVVILIIVGIIFGAFTTIIADQKGYSIFGWLILGFLFGPIALIAAVGLPDKKLKESIQELIRINKNNSDFASEDSKQKTENRKFMNNVFPRNKSAKDLKKFMENKQEPEK